MEEGTVATWLKKIGDEVSEGDILAEIETDKATMEFESFQSGTLLHIGLKEGETAKVDELLAIIGPKDADVSNIAKNFSATSASDSDEKLRHQNKKLQNKKQSKLKLQKLILKWRLNKTYNPTILLMVEYSFHRLPKKWPMKKVFSYLK